jgi:uridine kinase
MTQTTKIIGISGGSGSGKTTFVNCVRQLTADMPVLVLQLDHYYHDLSHLTPEERDRRNFDHPESIDSDLLKAQLTELAAGRAIDRPTYDFATHTRTKNTVRLESAPVIILDGIFSLYWEDIRSIQTLSVFVDVDDDVRFIRRLRRDINERGRTVEGVIAQYLATVKVMHDHYVAPQKNDADIIVRWMDYNDQAVSMVAGLLRTWVKA